MHYLKKAAMYTDIHFGAHNNSEQHNKDCIEYLKWFISNVKEDPSIDHIMFLGDYFEHRSSISGLTLDYAYEGAKLINEIGLPVFFMTGNHDYFYRNNRDIHNTKTFTALDNFRVINELTVVQELGKHGAVVCPFLFEHEFPLLLNYLEYPVVFGHFEFKGFVITGDYIVKEHGPDHKQFKKFKKIFSGHYHKRQIKDNIVYIGNTFPTNFADANDSERGMAIYDYDKNLVSFKDWSDAPTYVRCKLSELLNDPSKYLKNKATVTCLVDTELTYEESLALKDKMIKKFNLREFNLDEKFDAIEAISGDETSDDDSDYSIDHVIFKKLETVNAKGIISDKLVEIYRNIEI